MDRSRFGRRLVTLIIVTVGAVSLAACGWVSQAREPVIEVPGGDPDLGEQLLFEYGCVSCHTIPGVPGADTYVGPPLTAWAERAYIAGVLPNEPDNLIAWIVSPQAIQPDSAMPTIGVSPEEATHMAAYLYTLED